MGVICRGPKTRLFVRDGIINAAAWVATRQRIVFLLKENNGGRVALARARQIRGIGQSFGFCVTPTPGVKLGSGPAFLEAKRNFEKACRQIAIVNLKKTTGGNTSQRSQITQYARRDRLFLEEQLSL